MEIQGINLIELVKKHGAPIYVYDAQKIKHQYDRLTNAFSGIKKLQIDYACKANTNLNILKLLSQWGSGLDAVSIQEVLLGIQAGIPPQKIIYTPSGVSIQEINEIINLGVRINIDNFSILEYIAHEHPQKPVGIRLNPHVMAGGNAKISVGHIDSKFGISIHQIPHLKRIVENTNIKIEGFHLHTGSDVLDISVFNEVAGILLDIAKDFPDLEYIDFGGGFKVPYKEGDKQTNIELLGEKLTKKFNTFCKEYGKELTLVFEPGKFLVSEAGYFLASVNVVKQTTSTLFAGLDTGLNHLIRPMFYDAYHEIINISNPQGLPKHYTIVGYICETDTFGANRKINEIHENDILCFKNAGAYCYSMSSNYNSRYRPAEILILDGKDHLIRRQETMEDLLLTTKDIFL